MLIDSAACFSSGFRSRNNVSRSFVERTLISFSIATVDKFLRVNESPEGLSRLRFQMSGAALQDVKLVRAIDLLRDACCSARAKSTIKGDNVMSGSIQL
jgi:hypothetical protein